jgi:glycerol uptake facilitator-like aquaporin
MPVQASNAPSLWDMIRITLRVMWRVMRIVFHETTGVFFALFAVYGAVMAWRQWHYKPTYWLVAFAVGYAVMMAAFAFYSFRRARRIR